MDTIRESDGYVEARAGLSLYCRRWEEDGDRSPVVIIHGAGEHSGRYAKTAARLAKVGHAVHALDLPGHGRSPGVRGHIGRFDDYLACARRFIGQIAGPPPVLLGHSLGGLIATFYAIAHPDTIQSLVLSSPLWGLSVAIPWWKRIVARAVSPLWPSLTMERPRASGDVLSHDPQVTAQYKRDPLVHFRASVRLYTELLERFERLPRALPQLRAPTLVLQAGDDRIASTETVERLFPAVGAKRKRLVVYPAFYHEILNEVDKERVFQDLLAWLRDVRDDCARG
jgi:lysophospholipase